MGHWSKLAVGMLLALAACQTVTGTSDRELAVRVFDQLAFPGNLGGHPITTARMLETPYEDHKMYRWEGSIRARITGAAPPELAAFTARAISELADIAGRQVTFVSEESDDPNFVVEFVDARALYINNSEFAMCTADSQRNEVAGIVKVLIRIATKGPRSPEHCIYHEALHGFGLVHTDLVPSVMNYGTIAEKPTDWDILVIKTMYSNAMKSGLTRAQLLPRARRLLIGVE